MVVSLIFILFEVWYLYGYHGNSEDEEKVSIEKDKILSRIVIENRKKKKRHVNFQPILKLNLKLQHCERRVFLKPGYVYLHRKTLTFMLGLPISKFPNFYGPKPVHGKPKQRKPFLRHFFENAYCCSILESVSETLTYTILYTML